MKAHAIVVTVAVAQVAGSAMIEATVAIATTAVIAVIVKIATVKATPPDVTVVARVVMAVAKAQRQVLVIVSSVTPERRKLLLLPRLMQRRTPRITAQRIRQQPHDHRANQEKLASRANRVLIEVSEASAVHVASVLTVQIADHVMPM